MAQIGSAKLILVRIPRPKIKLELKKYKNLY